MKSIYQVKLDPLYQYEVDTMDDTKWSNELQKFDDASIYQTTGYSSHFLGGKDTNKFVLKKNGEICALALVRRRRTSFFRSGIAYIYWGPVWRFQGQTVDIDVASQMFNALYVEYVLKQNLYLRITPIFKQNDTEETRYLLKKTKFRRRKYGKQYTTIVVNIGDSLDQIRKNFRRNWRNHLNKAEKSGLEIRSGVDMNLYSIFMRLTREMLARKNFADIPDIERYKFIQNELPENLKMQVFVCYYENEPIASAVVSAIGNTGYYLLGATNNTGMRHQGSYLIQWHVLKWLKSRGCIWYDLCGIHPQKNPGVYHFKSGMGGDEVTYGRQFHAYQNKLMYSLILIAEMLRGCLKWASTHFSLLLNIINTKLRTS